MEVRHMKKFRLFAFISVTICVRLSLRIRNASVCALWIRRPLKFVCKKQDRVEAEIMLKKGYGLKSRWKCPPNSSVTALIWSLTYPPSGWSSKESVVVAIGHNSFSYKASLPGVSLLVPTKPTGKSSVDTRLTAAYVWRRGKELIM